MWCAVGACALLPGTLPHSVTIRPMSRNSVDRDLPLFADGSFPLGDKGHYGLPGTAANGTDAGIGQCNESTWLEFKTASCLGCWCSNGTQPCRGAQSCYWFSQGCSIGCSQCTGGDARSNKDLCGSGAKPTICDRRLRTYNLNASCGSADDLHKHNPWRAPCVDSTSPAALCSASVRSCASAHLTPLHLLDAEGRRPCTTSAARRAGA